MSFSGLSSFIFRERDQLSLTNASLFIDNPNNLESLMYFVNEVPLKGNSFREFDEMEWNKVKSAFGKGAGKYGVKIIRPLRILLMRVLNENMGFIDLHGFFFQLCLTFSVPREALPILEYPGLFKNIQKNQIAFFLIQGCDVYIKLKRNRDAFELLKRGEGLEMLDSLLGLKLAIRQIVLLINFGERIPEELRFKVKEYDLKEEFVLSAINLPYREQEEQKKIYLQKLMALCLRLQSWRPLQSEQQAILNMENLLQVYDEGRWGQISHYIRDQIRKNNWRIKATDIKSTLLDDLQSIKGINSNESIYRYDSQNKIMYFNHKQSDQQMLNTLITKSLNMSQEVANAKIERKEREMGFGGLGGLGVLGGLGGFGGRMMEMGMSGRR